MGKRRITVLESAAKGIAQISWFIESKGMLATADKFVDAVYDAIEKLADYRLIHAVCRDSERNTLGLKCKPFRRKYTIVFFETSDAIIVTEFIPSKLIK